jgi:heptosyltransferase-2
MQSARRLMVVMPTWFGDCLMATPTLRALHQSFPDVELAALIREPLAPLLEGLPGIDQIITMPKAGKGSGVMAIGKRLRGQSFDVALLMPNSFRSAAIAMAARIPRRVGYQRDGRGVLLTDRLVPRREHGEFVPVPTLDYYLSLASYLGAELVPGDTAMAVATRPEDDQRAEELLAAAKGKPVVLLNPGAQKLEKRWPADRFTQLAARCVKELDLAVAVTGSPDERQVLATITGAASVPIIDLPKAGMNLRLLKSVVKQSAIMVTNDTGPRHLAAACNTPVVTLFGPTTPDWTTIDFEHEIELTAQSEDGQPGSMQQISVDEVFDAVGKLLDRVNTPQAQTPASSQA